MAGLRRSKTKKSKPISNASAQTNLYTDDERELQRIIKASGKTRAQALRDLVSKGVRADKFQRIGKDESLSDVIDAQRSVVSAALSPLIAALDEEKRFVESSMIHMETEYASIEVRLARIENALSYLIKGFDRVLESIVLIRSFMQFYIFEFYYTVMVSARQQLTREQLQKNIEERKKDIKIEVAKERSFLGELTLEKIENVVTKNMIADAKHPPTIPPVTQTPKAT